MWQFLSVNVAHVNVGGDTYLYIYFRRIHLVLPNCNKVGPTDRFMGTENQLSPCFSTIIYIYIYINNMIFCLSFIILHTKISSYKFLKFKK